MGTIQPGSQGTKLETTRPRYPGPRGFSSFILSWQILRREPLLLCFFIGTKCWEPIKESLWSRPLGSSLLCHQLLTVASDWRIFLIALRVLWLDGFNIFGDAIRQKKMTSLTGVNCWASMKVRFSTILTRGFLSLGSALQLANLVPRAFSLAWGRGGTLKERSVYRTQTSYEQS